MCCPGAEALLGLPAGLLTLPQQKAACPLLKLEAENAGASWDKGFFSEKNRIEMVLQLVAYIFRCTRKKNQA